ncbi:MAG: hypothetical protein LC753_14765 [Acidobacteria bacterium]|nr:hypothetical protein [Acidobacteriota bacterium]
MNDRCYHRRNTLLYSDRVAVHIVEHPLVHDALATLRDAATPPELFRRMAVRISLLLAAEATRDVPSKAVRVSTDGARRSYRAPARRADCCRVAVLLQATCGSARQLRADD